MKTNHFKRFFQKAMLLVFFAGTITAIYAQEVEQESLDWTKLHLRPNISFYIPYADQNELAIPTNINLEAWYDLAEAVDVRAGAHIGNFKGLSAGLTLHAKDRMVLKKTRFIVSESMSSVSFYKGSAEVRSIFGPAFDVKLGFYEDTGIYGRLAGGLEWQTRSRAYYDGYRSSKNGMQVMRIQGAAAFLNMQGKHHLGLGGLMGVTWDTAPWKRVSFFLGTEFGALYMIGVQDPDYQWHPIVEVKLGASVKL